MTGRPNVNPPIREQDKANAAAAAEIFSRPSVRFEIHVVRQLARKQAARDEALVRSCVIESLRPRLRWIGVRPRALRLLKRLGLWTPPTLVYGQTTYSNATPDGRWRLTQAAGVMRPGTNVMTQPTRAD